MIDILLTIKLLIDFGLVVLILMVQFTIYPSFLFFEKDNLQKWHTVYTKGIAIVVGPLMIAQLLLSVYVVFGRAQYLLGGLHLLLVLATWIITALLFVPIHNRITNNTYNQEDLKKLVKRNWLRVVLWILVITTSILHYSVFLNFNNLYIKG